MNPVSSGKRILVTGAGSGIGRASALQLAREGATVGLLGRTEQELRAVADEIDREGGRSEVMVADIANEDEMAEAMKAFAGSGGLDAVVANAGINGVWAPVDELQPSEWDKTMAVNLRGTFLTIHFAVPYLKGSASASIVVVSSINGTRTFTTAGATAYAATKAAQVAMVKQLAPELGFRRIRINAVCPGAIETSIEDNTRRRHTARAEVPVEWPEGDIPLTRGESGKAEDVADAISFLVSDRARHVSGTVLFVDGAQSLVR